jgi:hypothetical protein
MRRSEIIGGFIQAVTGSATTTGNGGFQISR